MAFDFYFAGTQAPETDVLLTDLNCNILKSYVNDKKSIEKWFEYKRNGWKGKLLIDNGMQKKDLIDKIGVSSTTIAKMGKGEKVSLDVLERICNYFNCDIGDVMSFEK